MSKIKDFLKNNWSKLIIGLIVLSIAGYYLKSYSANKNTAVKTTKATRQNISEVVEVSGQVESSQDASLSFEKSGLINAINVKVGDKVYVGQTLATLSSSDVYAQINEANASVQAAQAQLGTVLAGATEGELNIKRQNVENAKQDLENAQNQISDTIRNTESAISDIVKYKLANMFIRDGSGYKMSFTSCDNTTQNSLENERGNFDNITIFDLDGVKLEADRLNGFILRISSLLNLQCSVSDSTLNDERATVSGIKSQLSGVFSEISNRKNSVQNAKNSLARSEKDLNFSTQSADKNRIASARASVNQSYARLAQVKSQASKNILTAPFAGVISEVNIEKGEISSPAKTSFKIISDSAYQVKAKISEIDIAKINLKDTATITLDAYPDQNFPATVSAIDPASTNDGGVSRYGVTLTFLTKDTRLKIGMTANAKIVVDTKENALTLPASYVKIIGTGGIVNIESIKDNKKEVEEKIVKIGLRGGDGKVEILEGVTEQDVLVEIAKDGVFKR
jgi:HlyD family secretion protein